MGIAMIRLTRLKRPARMIPPPEASQRSSPHGRHIWRTGLIAAAMLALVGIGYWLWQGQWIVTTGRIMARQVMIAPPVTGRLVAIPVREGDSVKGGQLLARLDDRELRAELRRAEAQAAQVRTRLGLLEQMDVDPAIVSMAAAAERDVRLAKQRYEQARSEFQKAVLAVKQAAAVAERWQRLRWLRAATQAEWENRLLELAAARAEAKAARARVSETLASYRSAVALLRHAQRARLHAERQLANERKTLRLAVQEAEAKIDAVRSQLAQLEVYAPQDGIVGWLPHAVGEVVSPRDWIMTILDPSELWVEAYVDGEELAAVRDGSTAWITVEDVLDTYVPGRVSLVYPAEWDRRRRWRIGPEAVRSPTRVASFIHPVKIRFDDPIPAGLQPEMVAYVWIARR